MNVLVETSSLSGIVDIPPSKSHTMRAILLASLADRQSCITNYLSSNDTDKMIDACRMFGAIIQNIEPNTLLISGVDSKPALPVDVIDSGNSGQVLYYAGVVTSLISDGFSIISGDNSIRMNRPVTFLLKGIRDLGGYAVSSRNNDYAPMIIRGPISPGEVLISGEASLPVSAMLILACFLKGDTTIVVDNPGEKAWVNLTLSWLDRGGIEYKNFDFNKFVVHGKGKFNSFEYAVPSDFSSSAYPIVAALLTKSEITLTNIDMNDVQGDKELITVLQRMGADIRYDKNERLLFVNGPSELHGCNLDINDFIDSITILAVVGCFARGETRIFGARASRFKECNRISCVAQELKKMGAVIDEFEDGLVIRESQLTGAVVQSHGDHRMALSLIVAGLVAEGITEVEGVTCIDKSFPGFVDEMTGLGAKISFR